MQKTFYRTAIIVTVIFHASLVFGDGPFVSGPVMQSSGQQIGESLELPDGWSLQRWRRKDGIYCVVAKGRDPYYVNVGGRKPDIDLVYWEKDGMLTDYLMERQGKEPRLYVSMNGVGTPHDFYTWDPGVISVRMTEDMLKRFGEGTEIDFQLDGTNLYRKISLAGSRTALRKLNECT